MFTEKQLAEILAVCEKATPGPWDFDEDIWWENTPGEQEKHGGLIVYPLANEDLTVAGVNHYFDRKQGKANAQLIALARTALPQLAEEIIKLREKYEQPNPKCGKGHENTLPLALWDCPMCTEELTEENTKLRAVARVAGQIQYMVEHYIRCCGGSANIDIAEEYKQALATAGYGGEE